MQYCSLKDISMIFCFRANGLQKEVIPCRLFPWSPPRSRRSATTRPENCCGWSSVGGRSIITSAFPQHRTKGLLGASSKGSYFNQAIRGRFPFCLISELQADAPDAQCPSGAGGGR